jgi:Xaa-Pro aminopeptidase
MFMYLHIYLHVVQVIQSVGQRKLQQSASLVQAIFRAIKWEYITAANYLNKLGHKMGHAWRGNETRPPRR